MEPVDWYCPACRRALEEVSQGYGCQGCGSLFPTSQGIVSFVDREDAYESIHPARVALASSWVRRMVGSISHSGMRSRFLWRNLRGRSDSLILDVGCGAGNPLLITGGQVVGIDRSWTCAARAREIYPQVAHGSATALPFGDETFHLVVGLDLYGHLPPSEKPRLIDEMIRVLKVGGRLALVIETDGSNWFHRFAKTEPALYRKYFIDPDGHIGLESASHVFERFSKPSRPSSRARLVRRQKMYTYVWGAPDYLYRFDNEYRNQSRFIQSLTSCLRAIQRSRWTSGAADVLLGAIARLVDPFLPWDSACGIMVCYEKCRD